jgi:hypothetical protein
MLYTVTYIRHKTFTEILNRKDLNEMLKFFEEENYYTLISVFPTTAEDIAGKVVEFTKATAPFDYEDAKEVGETDEDIIAKLAERLTENKDRFYDDLATFFDEPEILDSSEQEFREDILKIIKEF